MISDFPLVQAPFLAFGDRSKHAYNNCYYLYVP